MQNTQTPQTAAQGQNVRKPTDFPIGAKVRDIYKGKINTVSKSYWQTYDGGNTADYTIEFAGGGWNKSTNLEPVAAEAQPENSAKHQIKLARKAYGALEPLNNITWTSYREQLLKMCVAEEKDHRGFMPDFRESHTAETASITDAAKLFAVKRLAEYLNEPRNKWPFGKDFLHTQKSCFMAAGIVDEYASTVRDCWQGFDIEELANLDYTQIVQVRKAAA